MKTRTLILISIIDLQSLLRLKQAPTVFSSRILLIAKSSRKEQKEGASKRHCEVMHYFLETYGNNDVINKTDADIMMYTQQLNKAPIKYAEFIWIMALLCDCVYHEYVLKGNFIEGLQNSMAQSMPSIYGTTNHAKVQDLVTWWVMRLLSLLVRLVRYQEKESIVRRSKRTAVTADGSRRKRLSSILVWR